MENSKSINKLFSKDFLLVVIGQIVSIFGNQALRFALPLYLLNVTGSAALFGIISACSFIPMIVLCPIGGIIADRINKRNIMVILDFSTAALSLIIALLVGKVDIVLLLLISLLILYGIQGTYQPAVQASIPLLLNEEHIMQGNAIINLVNSLASLVGPIIGGILYSSLGIMVILYISVGCFLLSAIMEIFINIPYKKLQSKGNIFKIGYNDLKESFKFIKHDKPILWNVSLVICGISLFLSAVVIIGLPIVVPQSLGFDVETSNKLYGYAQGAIGAGSLIGGLLAGVLATKIKAKHSPIMLLLCMLTLIPIGLSLNFVITPMISYIIILISCVIMMTLAALFSIQVMSYLQILTPENMLGKVISCAMCIGMGANPIGQALYGSLFEVFKSCPYIPFYIAAFVTLIICLISKPLFNGIDNILKKQ